MTDKLVKLVIRNKLIVRPVSKPPMIYENLQITNKKKEMKNTSKELSILIKSKTGC